MSLASDLASPQPPSRKGPRCSIAILLDTLDADDADALRAALERRTEYRISLFISEQLDKSGIHLSADVIRRHMRGHCSCR